MEIHGSPSPEQARDAADFVALMRQLKDRSGLTFRQLEQRAAAWGGVLPRSTLADALRGGALPREEMLRAFLRVCGEEQNTSAWLEARDRIASARTAPARTEDDAADAGNRAAPPEGLLPGASEADGDPGPSDDVIGGFREPRRRRLSRRNRRLGAVLALLVVAGAGALVAARATGGGGGGGGEEAAAAPKTYQVRSLSSSHCLSELDGDESANVYLVDCDQVTVTYELKNMGDGVFEINSLHPVFGHGCLGVAGGSTRGHAMMQDDYCGHRGNAERFHLEPVGDSPREYRIRPLHTGDCVSDPKKTGIPAFQLPCSPGDRSQVFRFEPVPAPTGIPTMTTNQQ